MAEKLNLGYMVSAIIFVALIAMITIAHLRFKLESHPRLLDGLHSDTSSRCLHR